MLLSSLLVCLLTFRSARADENADSCSFLQTATSLQHWHHYDDSDPLPPLQQAESTRTSWAKMLETPPVAPYDVGLDDLAMSKSIAQKQNLDLPSLALTQTNIIPHDSKADAKDRDLNESPAAELPSLEVASTPIQNLEAVSVEPPSTSEVLKTAELVQAKESTSPSSLDAPPSTPEVLKTAELVQAKESTSPSSLDALIFEAESTSAQKVDASPSPAEVQSAQPLEFLPKTVEIPQATAKRSSLLAEATTADKIELSSSAAGKESAEPPSPPEVLSKTALVQEKEISSFSPLVGASTAAAEKLEVSSSPAGLQSVEHPSTLEVLPKTIELTQASVNLGSSFRESTAAEKTEVSSSPAEALPAEPPSTLKVSPIAIALPQSGENTSSLFGEGESSAGRVTKESPPSPSKLQSAEVSPNPEILQTTVSNAETKDLDAATVFVECLGDSSEDDCTKMAQEKEAQENLAARQARREQRMAQARREAEEEQARRKSLEEQARQKAWEEKVASHLEWQRKLESLQRQNARLDAVTRMRMEEDTLHDLTDQQERARNIMLRQLDAEEHTRLALLDHVVEVAPDYATAPVGNDDLRTSEGQ